MKLSALTRFSANSEFYAETGVNAGLEAMPGESISLSGDINVYFLDLADGELLPSNTRPSVDKLKDWSDIGLFGRTVYLQQGLSTLLAYGNENILSDRYCKKFRSDRFWATVQF